MLVISFNMVSSFLLISVWNQFQIYFDLNGLFLFDIMSLSLFWYFLTDI